MNKINTFQDMIKYITDICSNKITSHTYIPRGLLMAKVEESMNDSFTEIERYRLLNLYRGIPKNELLKMSKSDNTFKDINLYMDLDEMNDFQDYNTLLYANIQHKLYVYYKTLPNTEKKDFLSKYSSIFKILEIKDKENFRYKTFLLIFSIIVGSLLYLAKDNLDAYYSIAVSLLILIIGSGIYTVIRSFRSK